MSKCLFFSILATLSFAIHTIAMEDSFKKLADYGAETFGNHMERAGKEITKTLPSRIGIEFPQKHLWSAVFTIAGAAFIYNGLTSFIDAHGKTDEEITAKKQCRHNLYKTAGYKIAAGFMSLMACIAVLYGIK